MAIKVLVTGAAGQIGYSLVPLIARGDVFGDKPVHLVLLDIPNMMGVLNGVVMELQDCAYPLLEQVSAFDKVEDAFKDLDYAFLVGAMPRREGMERRDLLKANVKIFREQGEALEKFAKRTVKVLVVGNPANTNAFICMKHAPSIPKENFTAMTRLDQNRASAQIAAKAGVGVKDIRNVIIWGNHSGTQFPDARYAELGGGGGNQQWSPVTKKIQDAQFMQKELVETVQKRGAAVIAARKLSSAMSAAKAAADHMHDWACGTKDGIIVSMGVPSTGAYGIPKELMFSFPVKCSGGQWQIVEGLEMGGDFEKERIKITQEELEQERDEAMATVQEGK